MLLESSASQHDWALCQAVAALTPTPYPRWMEGKGSEVSGRRSGFKGQGAKMMMTLEAGTLVAVRRERERERERETRYFIIDRRYGANDV